MPARRSLRALRVRVVVLLAIALAVTLLAQSGAAAPGQGIDRRFSADAFWSLSAGCVDTFIGVFPVLAVTRTPPGPPTTGSSINVQIEQRDSCTDTVLLDAGNPDRSLPVGAFRITPGLAKAALHATVTVCDAVGGACFPLAIDLTYKRAGGRGDPEVCSREGEEEVTVFCRAEVSGVVSDGTTNFTPVPGTAVLQSHTGFVG